ncbi:hypothetical protein HZA39_03000 [Candidatus Peregrinibacteria bacterium]|nr:hypothetical protein [Candidatus Peregrinibacteria bacterium]
MNMQTNQHSNNEKRNIVPPKLGVNGAESISGMEVSEVGEKLSEIVRDLPPEEKAAKPIPRKKSTKLTPQQLKDKLLANLPSEHRMKAEIASEIKREVNNLQSKARNMVYLGGKVNYFELNNILSKIRELTDILSSLIKATFEMIKSLWFRFVHGIAL